MLFSLLTAGLWENELAWFLAHEWQWPVDKSGMNVSLRLAGCRTYQSVTPCQAAFDWNSHSLTCYCWCRSQTGKDVNCKKKKIRGKIEKKTRSARFMSLSCELNSPDWNLCGLYPPWFQYFSKFVYMLVVLRDDPRVTKFLIPQSREQSHWRSLWSVIIKAKSVPHPSLKLLSNLSPQTIVNDWLYPDEEQVSVLKWSYFSFQV